MGKAALLILSLFLCSFNRIDYNSVIVGTPASQVVQRFGEPYSVRDLGNDTYEYQYIERVSMNNELMYETHYFLTISDGKVANKRFRENYRPGYDQLWQPDPNYPSYP